MLNSDLSDRVVKTRARRVRRLARSLLSHARGGDLGRRLGVLNKAIVRLRAAQARSPGGCAEARRSLLAASSVMDQIEAARGP